MAFLFVNESKYIGLFLSIGILCVLAIFLWVFCCLKRDYYPKSNGMVLVVSSAVIPSDFYIRTRKLSGIAQMRVCLLKLLNAALL